MAIKGILFDLGNTLLHFDGDVAEMVANADQALAQSLIQSGLALDKAHFVKEFRHRLSTYHLEREIDFIEHTTRRILQQVLSDFGFLDVPDAIITEGLKKLYFVSQTHWIPEVDAIPTLAALRQSGLKLGIISNAGDDADVQHLVDKAEIRPYFDFIITSAAVGCRKPDRSIFELALNKWGFSPDETVMVGDTLHADILGANQVEIFSVWITRRANRPDNNANRATITPDATIPTLAELPALLEQAKP
ncbi:HAD family hydrolase [bacterium]|nr:HAD family hydrolase [bacterium]MCB2178960.1 HAD family hydrolase [bacterium]